MDRAVKNGAQNGGRGCARPGCREAAAATMTYEYRERTAWIDGLSEPGSGGYDLCAVHAETLRVPHGWQRYDLRLPTLPGFEPAAMVATAR
jgi:Protein of unknown function (DUF3499)